MGKEEYKFIVKCYEETPEKDLFFSCSFKVVKEYGYFRQGYRCTNWKWSYTYPCIFWSHKVVLDWSFQDYQGGCGLIYWKDFCTKNTYTIVGLYSIVMSNFFRMKVILVRIKAVSLRMIVFPV